MTNRTLSVPEIHCDHCKMSIEGALATVPGVERAEVHVEAGTVDLDYDGNDTTYAAIVEAIEDVGYAVPQQ
jgi:copper chaperone